MRIRDWSSDVCSSDLGRGGMLEQVLAEDVRTALRRCAAARATRRGCADSPGRPRGGRQGCEAAGDQLLVSCGPVKRSIWACFRETGRASCREIVFQYLLF